MHTESTTASPQPTSLQGDSGQNPVQEEPLSRQYQIYPHNLYADQTRGMTTLKVGDVEIECPARVTLPERTQWDAHLVKPKPPSSPQLG